jgi:hypothetical protein
MISIYASCYKNSISIPPFLVLILLFCFDSASAQKRILLAGSLKGLKEQQSYGLKFNYDSMIVGNDKFEKEYLEEKRRIWEANEPGKGDEFVNQWFDDREVRYEPAFIRSFEKYTNIKLNDKDAKYTMIVKTIRTEGGWDVGVMSIPGDIDAEIWIVESANESNVVAKIGFYGFAGKISHGGDFNMTRRIQSAYESLGKWVIDYLKRKAK